MKKRVVILIALIVFITIWIINSYNKMVRLDENIPGAWATVQSAYQRRSDLVPNLVSTVKGYAQHEKSTLTEVIAARAKATQVNIDPSNLTPQALQRFEQAQSGLQNSLSRLLVSVEQYPELKANQNFLDLQAQLEGTENRIKVERDRFNNTVQAYNTFIRKFPNNLIAAIGNFEKKSYFKASENSQEAPKVTF